MATRDQLEKRQQTIATLLGELRRHDIGTPEWLEWIDLSVACLLAAEKLSIEDELKRTAELAD